MSANQPTNLEQAILSAVFDLEPTLHDAFHLSELLSEKVTDIEPGAVLSRRSTERLAFLTYSLRTKVEGLRENYLLALQGRAGE